MQNNRINTQVFKSAILMLLTVVMMVVPGCSRSIAQSDTGSRPDIQNDDSKAMGSPVGEYFIEPDLSNVVNIADFDGELTPGQIAMIASNGFSVAPSEAKQIFWIYEANDYYDPKIPSFITVDSMLHTYHFFFDYVLRTVESDYLIPALSQLNEAMIQASEDNIGSLDDPDLMEAALSNLAYFSVAGNLLDGTPAPKSVQNMVADEVEKIEAHEVRTESTIFYPTLVDYTQFTPRGHYTRTEELEKYFRAMMWYGLMPFMISDSDSGLVSTRRTLLIIYNLREVSIDGNSALELWETIYEPTNFFVGASDNITFYDCIEIMDDVYGRNVSPDDFADDGKLMEFIEKIKALPGPGIEQYVPLTADEERSGEFTTGGRVYNFMGQRFIPDSRILQELVLPKAENRMFPTGLDIFAAMGSDRALDILISDYDVYSFEGYETQMEKMRMEMNETPLETWQSNLYYGWLWSLQSIIAPVSGDCPAFMQNDAWLDKSLFTALGSWTELRHDTVLYARQSGAECGDGDDEGPPKGYVEPNIDFWSRMEWLVESTRDGLESRELSDFMLNDRFEWLGRLVTMCREVAEKEMAGEEVTEFDYGRIEYYGGSLEGLMLSCAGGDLLSEADKDMALVVDVHTGMGEVLQEATGRVAVIHVVVPIEGELYLTRGGIYTQYEFTQPSSNRLTDEQWREMLNNGEQPPLAEWTESFMVPMETPEIFRDVDSGC